MNKSKIISEFSLTTFGSKGFLKGQLYCPECSRNDKFGILFKENGALCHCFYCSTSYSLNKILRDIGRTDLLEYDFDYEPTSSLAPLKKEEEIADDKDTKLPIGFMRIKQDDYLDARGFTPEQYDQFHVGVAELDPKTEDKIVFQLYQHDVPAGWMARSRKSKEWHHENLRRHRELGEPLVLRYRNSNNDFSRMLGGLDEIMKDTHTLILVEGIMDKANIDRLMHLNEQQEIKCCFTFGSDLSINQIDLIPESVDTVILMYDAGTIKMMKLAGGRLMSSFDVQVALIEGRDADPGSISEKELSKLLSNLKSFIYFYSFLDNFKTI